MYTIEHKEVGVRKLYIMYQNILKPSKTTISATEIYSNSKL